MKNTLGCLFLFGATLSFSQQQQQFSNTLLLNNSKVGVQSVQTNKNVTSIISSAHLNNRGQSNPQTNKVNPSNFRNSNTTSSNGQLNNRNRVARQNPVMNSNKAGGPNSNSNPANNFVNNSDEQIQVLVSDNNVGNVNDNNNDNNFNSPVLENVSNKVPVQQAVNYFQLAINDSKEEKAGGFKMEINISQKVVLSKTASSSSVRANRRTFQKKYAKFKRNFNGKLSAHKKSRHQVDICFNWR